MKPEMKKLIIANLPYLLFVYLFVKLGQTYRLAAGADLSEKLLHLADGFSLAFESAAPSFHLFDLAVGVAGAVALRLMVYCKSKNAKKYRRGVEYGSARWGGPKDIAPYIDPVFDNNILLTQTERLTMNNRPKDPKTARNKNVLVIGGSGSGKTRFFVKPNLMQCVSKDYPTSFVITDPKGSLIGEVGQLLVRCGYRVKVLNTINFSKSMRYNPFRYIHSEKDILKLVNTLICNTKGEGEKSAEDFWIKSERLLYSALIGYIWYEAPDDEMNFTTLLAVFVLLPLKSVLTPRKYPQNPGFSENRTKKERAQIASSQKQNRGLSCTLRFVILLLNLNGPVNRALDDRQKFFRAEFQLVADPLPQCAFLPHDLWVKIPFHGKPADFDKLYDNRQAGNRAVIFDVGKIAPVDIDLFRQRLTR